MSDFDFELDPGFHEIERAVMEIAMMEIEVTMRRMSEATGKRFEPLVSSEQGVG